MGAEMDRARSFAADLRSVYGDALASVVLYGSAARGEYREGVSDLNVLVLLRDTSPAVLRRGGALARAWAQARNPPPLFFGVDELRDSADVFPMELADMRDAHVLLHGDDPFAGLELSARDLRLQLERELKGAWIRLRTRYVALGPDPGELEPVLVKSLSTFLVMFRTVLRLAGDGATREPEAVIENTARIVGFDPAPLLQIHRARHGRAQLDARPEGPVATGYLQAVAKVVEYVDRFPAP